MTQGLPPYFFRIKDNGALVFRVDGENRQRRLDLDQIATVNINNGQVKPQGETVLSEADEAAIADWIAARQAELADRARDEVRHTLERMNLTAHWAQSTASDAELDEVTEDLLLAMHDLRSVLIQRRAKRLTQV